MDLKALLGEAYQEGMTVEQINEALAEKELFGADELERYKKATSKANSEAADYKRQLRAKLTEEEQAKAKAEEERQQMEAELQALKTEKLLAEHEKRAIALGLDDKKSKDLAKSLMEGNFDNVFSLIKAFVGDREQAVKADLLKNTSKPVGDGAETKLTKADLQRMTIEEQYKFAEQNPEQYKEIYGG